MASFDNMSLKQLQELKKTGVIGGGPALDSAIQRKVNEGSIADERKRRLEAMKTKFQGQKPINKLQMENVGEFSGFKKAELKKADSLPEFDKLRSLAKQRANETSQQNVEALRRRFASMGGLNSGAAIKQEQIAKQQAQQAADEQITQIGFQESQESQRRAERDQLLEQERLDKASAYELQNIEQAKQRNFNREMSNLDIEFKNKVYAFDQATKLFQLELANEQFDLDRETTEFNKRMAEYEAENSGGLFGGGGFLGLGL